MPKWHQILQWVRARKIEPRDVPLVATAGVLVGGVLVWSLWTIFFAGSSVHVALQPPGNERGWLNSPFIVIEYASLGCTDCIRFDEQVFPSLDAEYLETKKVHFIFHMIAPSSLALDGAALARCARQDDYFAFVDLMMRQRIKWANAADPAASLVEIAEATGMPSGRARNCLLDSNVLEPIEETTRKARSFGPVNDDLLLVVDGKPYRDPLDWHALHEYLERELAHHQFVQGLSP